MSFHSRLLGMRDKPETARAGVKWTEEENQELMDRVKKHMTLEEIAHKHQRTVSAVKCRVMDNALNMMNMDGLTLEAVARVVNIPAEDIEGYKRQKEAKPKPQNKKVGTSTMHCNNTDMQSDSILTLLTEIRDYLKIIAEK